MKSTKIDKMQVNTENANTTYIEENWPFYANHLQDLLLYLASLTKSNSPASSLARLQFIFPSPERRGILYPRGGH